MDSTKYKVELTLTLEQLFTIVEKDDSSVEVCLGCKHVFHKKKMCVKCGAKFGCHDQIFCDVCDTKWNYTNPKHIPCPKCKSDDSIGMYDKYYRIESWKSKLSAAGITESDIAEGLIKLLQEKYNPYESSENSN